jgi:hypothetical protein
MAEVGTDQALIPGSEMAARASAGDASAFEILAGRYQSLMYGVCRRITCNDQDAGDALRPWCCERPGTGSHQTPAAPGMGQAPARTPMASTATGGGLMILTITGFMTAVSQWRWPRVSWALAIDFGTSNTTAAFAGDGEPFPAEALAGAVLDKVHTWR